VAEHEELVGDPVLKDEPIRFLPTRFTLDGNALDAREQVCRTLACRSATWSSARAAGERGDVLLARRQRRQRQEQLPGVDDVGAPPEVGQAVRHHVRDGDKEANYVLNRYEELLFLPDNPDKPTVLEKTRTQGTCTGRSG